MTKRKTKLLSEQVIDGDIPVPNPDITVQSHEGTTLVAVQSAWHSVLVVPEIITIAGNPVSLTRSYRFGVGETKQVGTDPDQVNPIDAAILVQKQATNGGCCGTIYRTLNVFEGVYE